MRNFTPIEIDLCKKITEKERREIGYGDWYWFTRLTTIDRARVYTERDSAWADSTDCFPLWQEHDCLEWLINKGYSRIDIVMMAKRFVLYLCHSEEEEKYYEPDGHTILEALLRAVLTIMEGK